MPHDDSNDGEGSDDSASAGGGHYNPDEPRIPAGQPGGGQWTTGGNDVSSDSGSVSTDDARSPIEDGMNNPSRLPGVTQVADSGQIMTDASSDNNSRAGSSSDINNNQALTYNTVEGGQDLASWSVQWKLSQPSPNGGIIVQEVVGNASVSDGSQTISNSYHYWEAWTVPAGSQTTEVNIPENKPDDTFVDNNSGRNLSGSSSATTTAIFYEGMALPNIFKPGNRSTYAGALFSTTIDPKLPADKGTTPVVRTWSIRY